MVVGARPRWRFAPGSWRGGSHWGSRLARAVPEATRNPGAAAGRGRGLGRGPACAADPSDPGSAPSANHRRRPAPSRRRPLRVAENRAAQVQRRCQSTSAAGPPPSDSRHAHDSDNGRRTRTGAVGAQQSYLRHSLSSSPGAHAGPFHVKHSAALSRCAAGCGRRWMLWPARDRHSCPLLLTRFIHRRRAGDRLSTGGRGALACRATVRLDWRRPRIQRR